MNRKIIGISGKSGTGKTVLAQELLKILGPGWTVLHFAQALKEEVSGIFGFPLEWCYSIEGKNKAVPIWGGLVQHDPPKRLMTVRELLQWWGTDVRRNEDPDYWIKKTAEEIDELPEYVRGAIIDDVRFPGEAQFIRNKAGQVVRIMPYDGWKGDQDTMGHESETALDYLEAKGWVGLNAPHYSFGPVIQPEFGQLERAARELIMGWELHWLNT